MITIVFEKNGEKIYIDRENNHIVLSTADNRTIGTFIEARYDDTPTQIFFDIRYINEDGKEIILEGCKLKHFYFRLEEKHYL